MSLDSHHHHQASQLPHVIGRMYMGGGGHYTGAKVSLILPWQLGSDIAGNKVEKKR